MYLPSRDSHRGEGLGRQGSQLRSRREGKGQGGPPPSRGKQPPHTPASPLDTASQPQGASDGRDGQEGFWVRDLGVVGCALPERGLVVLGS